MKKVTSKTAHGGKNVPISAVKAIRQRHFGFLKEEIKEAAPTKAAKDEAASIAHRDGYTVQRALIYAIALIQCLPRKKQDRDVMADMCAIARAYDASAMSAHADDVAYRTGVSVELWPGKALGDAWDPNWAVEFYGVDVLEEPAKPEKSNQDALAGA